MENKIKEFLRTKMPEAENLFITGLKQNTEGFSYETFFFNAEWSVKEEKKSRDFVVRAEPKGGFLEPYDVALQYWVLKALGETSIPVPNVLWLETNKEVIGKPFFVMDRVEGEVPIPWGFQSHEYYKDSVKRDKMGKNMVDVLAQIHRVDWRKLGLDKYLQVPDAGMGPAVRELKRWEDMIREFRVEPEPVVSDALMWLKENMPNTKKLTLVHGDYRMGNFIWHEGRIAAFLDWEMVAIGDPMCDLGWFFMKHWRPGDPDKVHRLLDKEKVYEYYEEMTGEPVDDETVRYWTVMNNIKMFAIMVCATKVVFERKSRDLRLLTWSVMPFPLLEDIIELIDY
ncbi:MAG: phosphotransferase family protein [Desulfobacterales bacterium]|jgi:aminoglycoside phosphotransferase (APT) family kinase protein|nr:phosphotransferase family protein [Desulfobacterales bacterium]